MVVCGCCADALMSDLLFATPSTFSLVHRDFSCSNNLSLSLSAFVSLPYFSFNMVFSNSFCSDFRAFLDEECLNSYDSDKFILCLFLCFDRWRRRFFLFFILPTRLLGFLGAPMNGNAKSFGKADSRSPVLKVNVSCSISLMVASNVWSKIRLRLINLCLAFVSYFLKLNSL